MEPKFEQFKKQEAELQQMPTVKPEIHFELNDIAHKLMTQEDLSQKEDMTLRMLFEKLQDLDREIASFLDLHCSEGRIDKEQALCVSSFFLISLQVGPDSRAIRNDFYDLELKPEEFEIFANNKNIPEHTRNLIVETYKQLYQGKGNMLK